MSLKTHFLQLISSVRDTFADLIHTALLWEYKKTAKRRMKSTLLQEKMRHREEEEKGSLKEENFLNSFGQMMATRETLNSISNSSRPSLPHLITFITVIHFDF